VPFAIAAGTAPTLDASLAASEQLAGMGFAASAAAAEVAKEITDNNEILHGLADMQVPTSPTLCPNPSLKTHDIIVHFCQG
jgi:hypothetical protein